MADPRSFHEKTAAFTPEGQLKPNSCWVAILKANHKPSDKIAGDDFLWIKAASKFKGELIRDQYQRRFSPEEEWLLKHEFQLLNLQTTLAELDVYNDRLIVLEAVHSSDTSRYSTRQPLQPVAAQAVQQPQIVNAEPSVEPLKSPRISMYSPASENIFYQTPFTPGSHGRPSSQPRIPAQVSPQVFNPTINTLNRQASNAPHPSLNGRSPNASASPAPPPVSINKGTPTAGYMSFNSLAQDGGTEGPRAAQDYFQSITAIKPEPVTCSINVQTGPTNEPSLTAEELSDQGQKFLHLQNLLKDASPQLLEVSVEQGVKLLDRIKAPLLGEAVISSADAQQWLQQIEGLRKQAAKTKTIIGVVGNTGAGKSSVINAMLDEERLVPTNCMRACTAVVTEISYSYDKEPYRAQIEFINPADWEKELKIMFEDLMDGNGNVSKECANEDTDAGIAYAKIKAVYPRKTKEEIAKCSVEKLLQEVSHILGTTRDIKESNSSVFYKRLQAFVDSKEKSTGKKKDKDKGKKKEKKEMEFWPLIRVVRINVKSPALSTGAVIVDLPGVHDSNAARAAVAEGYMKKCTGLWIVAPINRAVDDKAAKSLLGESFKRQLKMDGGFSSVTFICSKTDDISLTEAQDSLGLDDEMAPAYEELADLKQTQKTLKKELEALKDSKEMFEDVANDADEQIEIWEGLSDQLDDGEAVYAPEPKSVVRKRKAVSVARPRKRRRTDSSDSEDSEDRDFIDDDSDESEEDDSAVEASQNREPLTANQISTKLQELKTTKKEARTQKIEALGKMDDLRKSIQKSKRAEDKIERDLSAKCISGRNQYSKGAIQIDFAAGIRELDQELAAEEDEENFNPDNDIRDYEEVARTLPVFCVSSRGYQKLCGRLEKDGEVTGFTTKEQTEIPQLQAHCEKLTETGRSANCRTFLNKLSQLLNSMTLWASNDGTGANMTADQRAREARFFQKGLTGLESGLEDTVKDACKELQDEFEDNIYDKYETAVSAAINESIDTAVHWGSQVNRDDRAAGGFPWSTYKALCRRNGVFTNAQGPHEWNAELAEPMVKQLAAGWEKTFSRRIPVVMAAFSRNATTRLKTFHQDVDARARKVGAGIAGLSMLQQQVGTYESLFKDLSSTVKDTILAHQKEINREFVPVIAKQMEYAYEMCTNEAGMGSFRRMKGHMTGHIENQRHTMFQASADNVKKLLVKLVNIVEEQLGEKTDEVFVSVRRDYRAVLGVGEVKETAILPRPQRLCRKDIKALIEGAEKIFERVANGELEIEETQVLQEDMRQEKRGRKGEDGSPADGVGEGAAGLKRGEDEGATKADTTMADVTATSDSVAKVKACDTGYGEAPPPSPSNQLSDGAKVESESSPMLQAVETELEESSNQEDSSDSF